MKVCCCIITYNIDPTVFLLQVSAIRRFCTDECDIHVVDNSSDKELATAIKYHCDDLGIEYKRTKSGSKNSSDSHTFALKFAYDMLRDKYDYFLFLDHDCIPVKPFGVVDTLGTKLMAGIGQGRPPYVYLWVGCLFMNTSGIDKSLVDFSFSHQLHLDTGGMIYKLIEKYGHENFIFFDEVYCQIDGFDGKYGYYSLISDERFLHMVGGSNWEGIDRHTERMNALINITNSLIEHQNVD